jgi:hypothetical protein
MEGEGEGELGLGELGGLGMGTGASIGDVADGGAMAATGETSVDLATLLPRVMVGSTRQECPALRMMRARCRAAL